MDNHSPVHLNPPVCARSVALNLVSSRFESTLVLPWHEVENLSQEYMFIYTWNALNGTLLERMLGMSFSQAIG